VGKFKFCEGALVKQLLYGLHITWLLEELKQLPFY